MIIVDHIVGKLRALRTLVRMMVWLSNWPEVWQAYRTSQPIPSLYFRHGLVLHSGAADDPIVLLHEVFAGRCYRRYVANLSSGVMVDIGANIGAATIDLASRFSNMEAYAYEPNPSTRNVLLRNIEQNQLAVRVHVYGDAIGRNAGEFRLMVDGSSVTATGYSKDPAAPNVTTIAVPMIGLDAVLQRVNGAHITFLKIDAEGAEADILEGASPSTLAAIGCVILEYHEWLVPGVCLRCQRVLSNAGFRVRVHRANGSQGLIYGWRDKK
jgi:FkbM family methyltransferase